MAEPVSIAFGIAARYATAVFELSEGDDKLAVLERDVDALAAALDASADLRAMIASPVVSRGEQRAAIDAIAARMGLAQVLRNTLSLMAEKRRLFVLPQLVQSLRERIAAHKGEVTADVAAAGKLSKAQTDKLAAALKKAVGKDVKINLAVDESLIGGLVVKVGSQMIDSSIRSKLANLQHAMKEVR